MSPFLSFFVHVTCKPEKTKKPFLTIDGRQIVFKVVISLCDGVGVHVIDTMISNAMPTFNPLK